MTQIHAALLLLLGAISVYSQGDCPSGSHPYTFNTCLAIYSDIELTFSSANTRCTDTFNYGQLALVDTASQLLTLQGYVRALGALDNVEQYSVGYTYDNGGTLVDVNGQTASDHVTGNIVDNGLTEDDTTCIALHINGTFIKVSCAETLPFICHYNLTNPGVVSILVNGESGVTDQITVAYGDTFNLSCILADTTASSVIMWTVNDVELDTEDYTVALDGSRTDLRTMTFVAGGTYTCLVTNSDGRMDSRNIYLFPDPNETLLRPSVVNNLVALPHTQTSLYIQWLAPDPSYVISPLLLQYTLYYSVNRTDVFMNSVSGLTTDAAGLGMYILEGLDTGAQYYITIAAENGAGLSDIPTFLTLTETFGLPPTSAPADVTLSRSDDNTALLATWTPVTTALPIGELAFYQVEFREARSRDISTIFIAPGASMSSIFNVMDAQSYEVRVAAAVQISREPREHELSPFSEWVNVEAIISVTEIPTDIPTVIDPILSEDATIVLSVVLPVVVILCIIIVLAVGVAIYLRMKSNDNEYTDGGRKKKNSNGKTDEEAVELSSVKS